MSEQDRLYIDAAKGEFVRGINKNNQYLKFENQKDLFMYAMAIGCCIPSEISGKRDGLFLDKDMNYEDLALIYSLVFPELSRIEELTDKEKVYSIAQNMANTGFNIIKQKLDENSFDNLTMKLLMELDAKYNDLLERDLLKSENF